MTLITIADIRGGGFTTHKIKTIAKIICFVLSLFASTSCGHFTADKQDTTNESAYQPPVVKTWAYSNERKIKWAKAITKSYSPVTVSLNINKLPVSSYADTNGFKPFSHPVDTEKFGSINRFPQKDFDVNKLPAKKLIYHTTILKAPKTIKAGPPRPGISNAMGLFGLNDAQGLDGVLVTCLYTDHNGFLWIATEKGIYRYDGQNLVRYITDPMRNTLCMAEDREGRLWMGSQLEGIAVLDTKTSEYTIFNQKQGMLGSNNVFFMLTDSFGRVWAGGSDGLNIIDPQKNTISRIAPAGLFKGGFGDIKTDAAQNIWVLCAHDLGIIDLKHNKITFLTKLSLFKSVGQCASLFFDSKQYVWISSRDNGSLAVIDTRKNMACVLHETIKGPTGVASFSEDHDGNVWYTYRTNIKMIDFGRHRAKDLVVAKYDGYIGNVIIETLTDKTNGTWIGTTFGLLLYRHNNLLVEHIGRQSIASDADDNNGLIYYGSNDGLKLVDRKNKTIRILDKQHGLVNDSVQNVILFPHGEMDINTNGGLSIIDSDRRHIQNYPVVRCYANAIDRDGKLWLTGTRGVQMYDPAKKTITYLGAENGFGVINDIMIDKDNNMWLVGTNGVFTIIGPKRETMKNIDLKLPVRTNFVSIILHDTGVNKWVGTTKGIYIINLKKMTASQFSVPQGLVDESVISLLKSGNTTYVGTNKGISTITPDPKSGKWRIVSFGREYGLEKINVGYWMTDNIARDGKYIRGDKGLYILDLSGNVRHTEPDVFITGLNLMDEPAYFTAPAQGNTDTTLQYNTSGKVAGPYNLPADLELPYHKNSLQFSYVSRSAFKADTAWYRYMLTGTDKTWRKKTSETTTGNYFNLLPGRYSFKVCALANDGTWGKPAIFNFTVLPPWWETWWARLIMLLLLAGLIRLSFDFRSRSLLRSKKLLEQKVAIRTQEVMEQKEEIAAQRDSLEQAFGDLKQTQSQLVQSEKMASLGELTAGIAHEIQNPLNFVNNFSEVNTELIDELREEIANGNLDEVIAIATDIQENEKKINMHGKRADAIVKGMLQHSRAGSGQKEPTDINKLADEYLRLSYHGLRAKDKSFNAEMVTRFDEKLPLVNVLPQETGRVLLNLFNNAFYAVHQKQKTAGEGYKPTLEVSTSLDGNNVIIKVKDNGMGIPDAVKEKIMQPFFTTKPTGEGTGLGLSLSYDIIVKGHGGTMQVNSVESEGSEFIILVPTS